MVREKKLSTLNITCLRTIFFFLLIFIPLVLSLNRAEDVFAFATEPIRYENEARVERRKKKNMHVKD